MKTLLLTKDEVGKLLDIKDTIDAVEEGYKAFNSGEIILETKCCRTDDDEITLFDTTGMAIQDNVTAYKIYQRAVENNVGTYFEFF